MFDIGFSEILLVFVIGLIVLGPERLPVAVRTVMGWIRALRSLASNVQQELAQELKLQEFQDSLKKVEEVSKGALPPELRESMEELRKSADSMQRTYREALHPSHDSASEDELNSASVQPLHSTATQEVAADVAANAEPTSGLTPAQVVPVTASPVSLGTIDTQEQADFVVAKKPDNH